jgi:hypothetical protein
LPFCRHAVRGGNPVTLQGTPPASRVVVLQFASVDKAQAWWNSPGRKSTQPIGDKYATTRVFAVEGVTPCSALTCRPWMLVSGGNSDSHKLCRTASCLRRSPDPMTPLCPVCKEPMKEQGRSFRCEPCRQFIVFFEMPDASIYIAHQPACAIDECDPDVMSISDRE